MENSLPALRQELSLLEGEEHHGAQTWLLYDPLIHKYYGFSSFEFDILSRWNLGTAEAIITAIKQECTYEICEEDIASLSALLAQNHLLRISGEKDHERLLKENGLRNIAFWKTILHHYLFFRIPLIAPDEILSHTLPYVRWFGSKWFLSLSLVAGFMGLFGILQQWESFWGTFSFIVSIDGIMISMASLVMIKTLHELGHAFVLKSYQCSIPTMGVAFMVMWPVLYTDATDAWKIKDPKQRLNVAIAGMGVEFIIASWALLVWNLLPDGIFKSIMFTICTTTLALTLIVNLNPFMRFDGYYILSDIWKIPNLQEHAFSLAKWWLREKLWQLNTSKPYHFGAKDERLLILYAFSTWVYRFFLFFGIALMVYHLFFKLLGIFLMCVEIVWFIIKPITNELFFWWQNRQKILSSKGYFKTFLGFFIFLLVMVVPWKTSITIPALFRSEQVQLFFIPIAAQLESLHVKEGMLVSKGDVLVTLSASPLMYEKQKSASQIKILEEQIAFWRLNEELRQHLPKLVQELMATKSQLQAYVKEEGKLVLKAPFDGVIAEVEPNLRIGDWLAPQTPLLKLLQPSQHLVEAYVSEYDLNRFVIGAEARFYPSDWTYSSIPLQVIAIRRESERSMKEPFLVSSLGGEIPTREDKSGLFIPQVPLYKVVLAPLSEKSLYHYPMLRGRVVMKAKAESFSKIFYRWILIVIIQESNA